LCGGGGDVASWIDHLLQILCELYREWGGNCEDLGTDPSRAAEIVLSTFNNNGPPKLTKQSDIDDLLEYLADLNACLNDPDNTLPSGVTAQLKSMIETITNAYKP
jgi:hypothetical protein